LRTRLTILGELAKARLADGDERYFRSGEESVGNQDQN
jgi:hypothetical protein